MTKKQESKIPRDRALVQVTGEDLEARRSARLSTLDAFKKGRTALEVIQIGEQAEEIASQAVAQAMHREPPRHPLACAEGCAWCCYQRVGVAVPEVIRIAEYFRNKLTPPEIKDLVERLQKGLAQRRHSSPPKALPCILLVNDRCSAYPVRPLTCRGFNSSDAILCQASATDNPRTIVPIYARQLTANSMVLDGLRAGLKELGFSGDLLELTAALHIALTIPDALNQWLEGKSVFASARLP